MNVVAGGADMANNRAWNGVFVFKKPERWASRAGFR